jgi:hypothetical protein
VIHNYPSNRRKPEFCSVDTPFRRSVRPTIPLSIQCPNVTIPLGGRAASNLPVEKTFPSRVAAAQRLLRALALRNPDHGTGDPQSARAILSAESKGPFLPRVLLFRCAAQSHRPDDFPCPHWAPSPRHRQRPARPRDHDYLTRTATVQREARSRYQPRVTTALRHHPGIHGTPVPPLSAPICARVAINPRTLANKTAGDLHPARHKAEPPKALTVWQRVQLAQPCDDRRPGKSHLGYGLANGTRLSRPCALAQGPPNAFAAYPPRPAPAILAPSQPPPRTSAFLSALRSHDLWRPTTRNTFLPERRQHACGHNPPVGFPLYPSSASSASVTYDPPFNTT